MELKRLLISSPPASGKRIPLKEPLENIFTVRSSISFSRERETLSILTSWPSVIPLKLVETIAHFSMTSLKISDLVIVTLKFSRTFWESEDPDLMSDPTSALKSFKNFVPIFACNSASTVSP